jgi:ribosomal protein S27AE
VLRYNYVRKTGLTELIYHQKIKMPKNKAPQVTHSKPPSKCPKPYCGGTAFTPHEDGWQCINCMKIIYDQEALPYIANNHPERVGQYNYHKSPETQKDTPRYGYSDSANFHQGHNPEQPATECAMLDNETWEWLPEYDNILALPEIHRFVRIGQLIGSESS